MDMEISILRVDINEDRKATMARFLNGLRPGIADQLELQYYVELEDMVEKAIKIERRLKRRGATRNYTPSFIPSQQNFPPMRDDNSLSNTTNSRPRQEVTSTSRTSANKADSRGASKPANEASSSRNRDTKCWRCQGVGHIASQCPNQRAMLMLPNGEIITDDEEEEYNDMPPLVEKEEELEEISTNDKVGLVARRALAT